MPLSTALVVLVSDTHLGAGAAHRLTSRLGAELAEADAVLHAGDLTHGSVLEALAACAPRAEIHAVAGNCDGGLGLPERLTLRIGGCAVAMLHDSGTARGRTVRLRRRFPDADLVVFGHSHVPWHAVDVRSADDHVQHHVNPGSAMQRRRAPTCTIGRVLVTDGVVASVRHIPLP
jgi:putative phosphoesterase